LTRGNRFHSGYPKTQRSPHTIFPEGKAQAVVRGIFHPAAYHLAAAPKGKEFIPIYRFFAPAEALLKTFWWTKNSYLFFLAFK